MNLGTLRLSNRQSNSGRLSRVACSTQLLNQVVEPLESEFNISLGSLDNSPHIRKKRVFLSGERLLKSIDKKEKRLKKQMKEKKIKIKKSERSDPLDIDRLTQSMSNIMASLQG
jgi:hypothetical protein